MSVTRWPRWLGLLLLLAAIPAAAADRCHIGGTFYASGALNPANSCQSCQPTVSTTAWTNRANGSTCDDGNACTYNDTCNGGVCGGTAITCTSDQCNTRSCNGTSSCTVTPLSGTACNDGNGCTGPDTCQSGVCTGPCQVGQTCGGGCAAMQCTQNGSACSCQSTTTTSTTTLPSCTGGCDAPCGSCAYGGTCVPYESVHCPYYHQSPGDVCVAIDPYACVSGCNTDFDCGPGSACIYSGGVSYCCPACP